MLIERPAELLPWRFPHGANNTGPFAAWLRPSTLWLLVALYVLHKPLLRRALKCKALPMSRGLTAAIAVHNLGLAVYSAVTLYHTMSAVVGHYRSRGFEAVYCDADHAMWDGTPFGWWATLFYVSKFYEFLDTTVLILKGKEPSFLQAGTAPSHPRLSPYTERHN